MPDVPRSIASALRTQAAALRACADALDAAALELGGEASGRMASGRSTGATVFVGTAGRARVVGSVGAQRRRRGR